jgi:hypothetical protein
MRASRFFACALAFVAASGCALESLALEAAIPQTPRSFAPAFAVQKVVVDRGRFEAAAHATGAVEVQGGAFTVPIGPKRHLRCGVVPEPWNLATQLQAQVRALGARERVGLVRTAARLGDSGRPYLVAEALYGPPGEVRGVAQFGVFGSSEGTVVCTTSGDARIVEVLAIVEELAESQRWSGESARERPLYAETKLVYLGDAPVGFEYHYLRRRGAKGLSWFKVRGLTGRVKESSLTGIDDVTIERLDDERHVIELRELLTSDGKKTYDVVVQREPDGSLGVTGTAGGRVQKRTLPSDKPIESDLSMAPLLRSLLAGKVPKVTGRRVVVEGTEVRIDDEAFTRRSESSVVGPGSAAFSVDERGFVRHAAESEETEGAAMRVERTRVVGAIP